MAETASAAGAANLAARGASTEAGTSGADSTTVSCDLIRVGVFFDGTGNSRAHHSRGDVSWHTNVDLLEHLYTDTGGKAVRTVNGQQREVSYFSRYMRGIGVEAGGGTTTRGMAWGTGSEGVENRVSQAMNEVLQDLRSKARGIEPCDLWFDAFGFSRGAAAARDFANGVRAGEITYGAARRRVKFLGLFDTVSSIGSAGNTGNYEGVNIRTRGPSADSIGHITAKDEIREYFPLTLAMGGRRIAVVGAHSDIGGGYHPTRDNNSTFAFLQRSYPDLLEWYEARWGVTHNAPGAGDNDSASTGRRSGANRNPRTTLRTSSVHGLQFVTLRLMFDMAKAAGVPLPASLPSSIAGTNVAMAEDLLRYYQALSSRSVTADMERTIRRRYAHLSINNTSNWGFHAHLPRESSVRQVVTM